MDETKKKATKAKKATKGPMETALGGDLIICIGGGYKAKAPNGVQLVKLEGFEETKDGDRFAVALLTPSDMWNLGWKRRK